MKSSEEASERSRTLPAKIKTRIDEIKKSDDENLVEFASFFEANYLEQATLKKYRDKLEKAMGILKKDVAGDPIFENFIKDSPMYTMLGEDVERLKSFREERVRAGDSQPDLRTFDELMDTHARPVKDLDDLFAKYRKESTSKLEQYKDLLNLYDKRLGELS
jgi:hypothetical protein